jgi:hypothetical protein
VLDRFKGGDDPVFLISLKAGGFGRNLTEAGYCFLLDPWWNPVTEAQAIDRTHRIGQFRPVMVYRMIACDTIEGKVVALARRKAELFNGVMDEGDCSQAASPPRTSAVCSAEPRPALRAASCQNVRQSTKSKLSAANENGSTGGSCSMTYCWTLPWAAAKTPAQSTSP